MNAREYENAIAVLESAVEVSPENRELKIKLAHAYAGAGGFEAVQFAYLIKQLENTEIKNGAKKILQALENALSKVPQLTDRQRNRINQAIQLYDDLGLDPYTTSKENNFKWGVLHVYRLLVTFKHVVTYTKAIIDDQSITSQEELERYYIRQANLLIQDIFKSYQLFKNSFDKLNNIALKMEALIKSTVGNAEFKFKIESKAQDYRQFIRDLVGVNKEILSDGISQIFARVDSLDVQSGIRSIFAGFGQNRADVSARLERLKILAKIFLDNVILNNSQQYNELRSIFTQELKDEALLALNTALQEKDASALKLFMTSKDSQIKIIANAFEIIKSEYNGSPIPAIAYEETRVLLDYINKEQAKILEAKAREASRDVGSIAHATVTDLNQNNSTGAGEIRERVNQDGAEILGDIRPHSDAVVNAVNSRDSEMDDKAGEIVEDVREFVEKE